MKRFAIIASQFNRPITAALVRGATEVLRRSGVPSRSVQLWWVPGVFELPVMAARLARRRRNRPDAIIAVGAILRGETSQYQALAQAVAEGLGRVAVDATLPVTFGVVVAETPAQARARAGGAVGNRGAEAAMAALAVLNVFERIP